MIYFVATTEETSVEELTRLFRDNMQKLHGLPKSIVSDRRPQFAAEMTNELNCYSVLVLQLEHADRLGLGLGFGQVYMVVIIISL